MSLVRRLTDCCTCKLGFSLKIVYKRNLELTFCFLFQYKQWCIQVDQGLLPLALIKLAREADRTRGKKKETLEDIPEGAEDGENTAEEDDGEDLIDILEKTDQAAERLLVDSSGMLLNSGEKKHSRDSLKAYSPKPTTISSGKQPVKGRSFKIPNLINKTRTSETTIHSDSIATGASGFLSDLSSYSTIGFNDVGRNMGSNSEENTQGLNTIIEEEVPENSDVKTNTKLPLLPTFVNEFQGD